MRTRSPFPGMDPWLESEWSSVHARLISELQRQIHPRLPSDLFVRIEETVYVIDAQDSGDFSLRYRPDVAMFHRSPSLPDSSVGTATLEPEAIRFTVIDEPITEGFIEIRRFSDGHPLVTAIEVLSPTNKLTAEGRRTYLGKRKGYHDAGVNLVEIDLLRSGLHMMGAPVELKVRAHPKLMTDYRCMVRRRENGLPVVDVYPISLRSRLPEIRVPLRTGQQDISVDLQPPIDLAYELGSYGRLLDYSKPPIPPLSPEDAEWAAGLINQSV